jgi:hypothetical protein
MQYKEALKIGRERAEAAAALLEERTGLASQTVCAVKDLSGAPGELPESDRWAPVGEESFADIAVCRGRHSVQNALPLVVDDDGVAKACTWDFLTVKAALRILELVRLPVSRAEGSRLRELLDEQDLTETVRWSTLRMEA